MVCWYVWKRPGRKIRIRGDYGSPEFMSAYQEAVSGANRPDEQKSKVGPETLSWLFARYQKTTAWTQLSMATKRQRENIAKHVLDTAGTWKYRDILRTDIISGLDKRRHTPSAANNFLATMKGLFSWANEAGLIDTDPTLNLKHVSRPKTGGFHQWTEDEIQKFEAYWPVGTRERLALALLVYTGLRRGDAARLGRQHIKNGVIVLPTEKTGTVVTIPILPELQSVIEASPTGDLAIVATHTGRSFTKEAFGNWFKKACIEAGVPGSAHGLRKAGATRAAESGASVHQLNALFGWTGTRMASLYTEKADRARLAQEAVEKLTRNRS